MTDDTKSSGALSGPLAGLLAALLFGSAAPVAKLFIASAHPLLLAGLLYAGAGLGGIPVAALRGSGARLHREDLPVLAGMAFFGGLAGPVLLMVGLARGSAVAATLLLNLEAPLTILLAVMLFGDHLGWREALGAGLIIVAAAALGGGLAGSISAAGALAIAGACLCWALDNNLAQRVSLRDPVRVVVAKALPASAFSLTLALAAGAHRPPMGTVAALLVTGALGYGLSVALHVFAVRQLGAARQAALFATAPFVGALLAVPLLHESPGPVTWAAGVIMAGGIWLLLSPRHSHRHVHEPQVHEHVHVHDEHHRHTHAGTVTEPHSHVHTHERLEHEHPHTPDLHHRHGHPRG